MSYTLRLTTPGESAPTLGELRELTALASNIPPHYEVRAKTRWNSAASREVIVWIEIAPPAAEDVLL